MTDAPLVVILGKRGMGKTYLAKTLTQHDRRIIFIETPGKPEYSGDEFLDVAALVDWCGAKPGFRVVWRGGIDHAETIFHLAFALRDVSVLLDECGDIPCAGWFREVVYRGRSPARIALYALAQRPQILSPDIRSQATSVYSFNQSEPAALTWCRPIFAEHTPSLPRMLPKHGLHYSVDSCAVERFRLP